MAKRFDTKKKPAHNEFLIEELLKRYSKPVLAKKLMDILNWTSDAAYRRIRGTAPFTFDEVLDIAKALGISIDNYIKMKNGYDVLFSLALDRLWSKDTVHKYYENINNSIEHWREVCAKENNSLLKLAYNYIPSTFYLNYAELKRFILFKWGYQFDTAFTHNSISQLEITEDTAALNLKRLLVLRGFQKSEYILDRRVFLSMVDDIMYFVRIHLISPEELKVLKETMLAMLSEIEQIATNGSFPNGNRIDIHISQIDFHFCYAYFTGDTFKYSRIRMYQLNCMYTDDPRICRMHEECIDSLKKYSILISLSNEIYRANYFREQRNMIETMMREN